VICVKWYMNKLDRRIALEATHSMKIAAFLNLIGLLLITCGSIGAAPGSPSPQYKSDGSVGLSASGDEKVRKRLHRLQRCFPKFLWLVGIGAALQVAAQFLSA
jgi:hypothetical protein